MQLPRLRQKKKKSFIGRATKVLGGVALAGSVGAATGYGIHKLSSKLNTSNKSNGLSKSTAQAANSLSKKARNSELIAKRRAALGGSAAALNRKGRNPAELAVIKSKQRLLGKKNAAKAKKLRSQGLYFSSDFWNACFSRMANFQKTKRISKEQKNRIKAWRTGVYTVGGALTAHQVLSSRKKIVPINKMGGHLAKSYFRGVGNGLIGGTVGLGAYQAYKSIKNRQKRKRRK